MKGFVRILESIIASVILLTALSFFFIPAAEKSQWDDALLQLRIEDSLASLEKNSNLRDFVKRNDIDGLNNALKKMLPKNVEFSVIIKGIPKPEIKVRCFQCSGSELGNISFSEFSYKNRTIKISSSNETDGADILVFFDVEKINETNSKGKILLIDSLTESDITNFIENYFGIYFCQTCSGSSGKFYKFNEPNKTSFKIANYYSNISNQSFNKTFNFANSKIQVDENTIINSSASFMKVYDSRKAWMISSEENLTKSIIMWLSENYKMDPPYKKEPSGTIKVYEYFGVLDGFEPFEINLRVWRIFE